MVRSLPLPKHVYTHESCSSLVGDPESSLNVPLPQLVNPLAKSKRDSRILMQVPSMPATVYRKVNLPKHAPDHTHHPRSQSPWRGWKLSQTPAYQPPQTKKMPSNLPPQIPTNIGRHSFRAGCPEMAQRDCFLWFPNSPKQAVGREAPASRRRLFSTDHLGKSQIWISWLECKGCEMLEKP